MLFFISLNWVAFINIGRRQVIEATEGFILKESFCLIRCGLYDLSVEISMSVLPLLTN